MKIGDRVKVRWFTLDAGGIDIPGTVECAPNCGKVDIRLDCTTALECLGQE
jgi:hypothetical protein